MAEQLNCTETINSDGIDNGQSVTDTTTRNPDISGISGTPDINDKLGYQGSTQTLESGWNNETGVISTLGYSRKLGTSVLTELDSRTSEMMEVLRENTGTTNIIKTPTGYTDSGIPSYDVVFNTIHDSQFHKMNSLDQYYTTIEQSGSETVTQFQPQSHEEHGSSSETAPTSAGTTITHPSAPPETPRKNLNTEILESESVKRMKLEDSTAVVPKTPVPISDVTRRIRRLRLRNSLVSPSSPNINDETKNSIRYKPLSDSKQKPMKLPSFLMPTITSLNRMKKPVAFSPLASTTQSRPRRQQQQQQQQSKSVADRQNNLSRSIQVQRTNKQSGTHPTLGGISDTSRQKQQVDNPNRQDSVFDRLYRQTTISRSMSMNNVAHRRDAHSNNTFSDSRSGTSKIAFGRSKTQGSLSSHLTTNVSSSSGSRGSNSNSDSASSHTRRPVWR